MRRIVLLSFALSANMMMLASSAKSLDEIKVKNPDDKQIELAAFRTVVSSFETKKLVANPVKTKMTKISPWSIGTKAEGDLPFSYYFRPAGFFFFGVDHSLSYMTVPILLGAGYSKATWKNFSSDATSYKWIYADPTDLSGNTFLESSQENLAVDYTTHLSIAPYLTATSTVGSRTYQMRGAEDSGFYLAGGEATLDYKTFTGVSSKDFSSGMTAFHATKNGDWWFGTGPSAKKLGIKGLGIYMEQPVHAYALKSMYVLARNFVAEPDAEFKVNVYRFVSTGMEVIATGTCLASDANYIAKDDIGGYNVSLSFLFEKENPSTGIIEQDIPTIDFPIFVEFTGYQNPKVKSMSLFVSKDLMPNIYGESGFFITNENNKTVLLPVSKFFTETLYTAPSIFLDIAYTWIETDDNTFQAPINGGSKIFDINSYYYSTKWTIKEAADGTLPEWITYAVADDKENATGKLTFHVAPLPAGIASRSFDVTLSTLGSSKVFKISQSVPAGVNDAVTCSVKVTNVGGDFMVSYPSTVNAVKIYNASGQFIKNIALTETGSTIIPAQELAKGTYILKFNDNQSIKVVK